MVTQVCVSVDGGKRVRHFAPCLLEVELVNRYILPINWSRTTINYDTFPIVIQTSSTFQFKNLKHKVDMVRPVVFKDHRLTDA